MFKYHDKVHGSVYLNVVTATTAVERVVLMAFHTLMHFEDFSQVLYIM